MEKLTTFTQFEQKKHPHQLVHNCAFMHNCYSNRAYMHGYCSMCIYYFINFRSYIFFSLFFVQNQWTQFSSPHLLFPKVHTNKHTHTYTQTHPHRHTNTEIHKHTHTQTNPHGQTDRETDRSSWVLIGAWSELVGLDRCLIGAHGSWSVLVGLLLEWSLTEMGLAWSELRRFDREGELICVGIEMGREMGLVGDRCLFGDWVLFEEWSYLWRSDPV